MNQHDLESWAIRAAQELRELVDDAEDAVTMDRNGEVALSAKALLKEFDDIFHGRRPWASQLAALEKDQISTAFLDAAGGSFEALFDDEEGH